MRSATWYLSGNLALIHKVFPCPRVLQGRLLLDDLTPSPHSRFGLVHQKLMERSGMAHTSTCLQGLEYTPCHLEERIAMFDQIVQVHLFGADFGLTR